jgi:hypothetical protein
MKTNSMDGLKVYSMETTKFKKVISIIKNKN